MEFLLQASLLIYFRPLACMYTTSNLLSSPCAFYKANILLLCYITLLALESFITFSMSHDHDL